MTDLPTGRVLQVNVSRGGVPKLPVERARVGRLGLEGDGHRDETVHGGPGRAVALFGIEAIRRVASEGHPIAPGSTGENLTTEGIELSRLPVGTRILVGDEVVLEVSKPADPCTTIAGSFMEGRIARIGFVAHPDDSRMYARVLHDGEVRPGDAIRVLPPPPDSQAAVRLLLERLDAARRGCDLARWHAAVQAGFAVDILDDGELAIAVSADLPGPAFNRAHGLTTLPHLLPRALDPFRRAGLPGWLPMDEAPWPGAVPVTRVDLHLAPPDTVLERAAEDRLLPELEVSVVRTPQDLDAWTELMVAGSDLGGAPASSWRRIVGPLATMAGHHLVLARLDGTPVGVGLVAIRRRIGYLRSTNVVPEARGRGIQRALIAARARIAGEAGAELIGAGTSPDGAASVRNLVRLGFEHVWSRPTYRFDP